MARVDERPNHGGIAEKQELAVRMARKRQFGAGNNDGGAVVSPHRIKCNTDLLNHAMTARPLVCLCQNSQSAVTDLHANSGMKEIAVRF